MVTQEELKKLMNYNPLTGLFTWLVPRGGRALKGAIAGTINKGYTDITLKGKRHGAHRLAFLYMTGKFPKDCVDHIDSDRGNNKWYNLREATTQQNAWNGKLKTNNTSGHKNVYWSKSSKKWSVMIRAEGCRKFIGYYRDLNEASSAAATARQKYHGEYARHDDNI